MEPEQDFESAILLEGEGDERGGSRNSRKRLGAAALVLLLVVCPGALAFARRGQTHVASENEVVLDTVTQAKLSAKGDVQASNLREEANLKPEKIFHRVGNFIAAFDLANASHGTSAKKWGLWVGDPGRAAVTKGALILARSSFDWYNPFDWWSDELFWIKPGPVPLPAGEYKVRGDTTQGVPKLLTVSKDGSWSLEPGVTLDAVTHHPSKAYRYMGTRGSDCGVGHRKACTAVEYKVLIVTSQTVDLVPHGALPRPYSEASTEVLRNVRSKLRPGGDSFSV